MNDTLKKILIPIGIGLVVMVVLFFGLTKFAGTRETGSTEETVKEEIAKDTGENNTDTISDEVTKEEMKSESKSIDDNESSQSKENVNSNSSQPEERHSPAYWDNYNEE